jgi:hypothetical protein
MTNIRERLSLDGDWRFALGHAYDAAQDYGAGTSHFSYLAKAGFGAGAAAPNATRAARCSPSRTEKNPKAPNPNSMMKPNAIKLVVVTVSIACSFV